MQIEIPEIFEPLFTPCRYKACYGGRGSAKSWSVAKALLVLAARQPLRILCAREIQKSIKDSVKRLLDDQISSMGLSGFYKTLDAEIRGKNGSLFRFAGLRTNPDNIKSMEGLDIAWVEEAHKMSKESYEILYPTLRKKNSELWFTWNPNNENDPVDRLFRGKNPPPGSFIQEVNYDSNPFFPDELRAAMEWDRKRDIDLYNHVWRGEYKKMSEARVFKNWRVEEFEVPADARLYFGADWGFSVDPTVLICMFISGRTIYITHEAYEVGCEIDDIPALFAGNDPQLPPRWTNKKNKPGIPGALKWKIRADSARPETISYLKKRGFDIVGAIKGARSIEDGIEFLKSFDIVIHPRCKQTIDEFTFYAFKTDPHTGEILPVLQDKKNHVIDSARYALENHRRSIKLPVDVGAIIDTTPSVHSIG